MTNRWLVLALLLGIAVFNYGDRYLLSGLVKPIKAEFGASDGLMGLLMGPAFAVLYAVLSIPAARLADRTSRLAVLCGGCVIWSLFTVLTGLATSTAMLAVARVGVGVGEAAFQAPAFSLIAAFFPPEQRGRAFGIFILSNYFGQLLGYAGGPAIAAVSDWRMAFFAMGAGGLAFAALAWLAVREPRRAPAQSSDLAMLPLFALLLRTRAFVLMTLGYTLGVLSGVAFGIWAPALFQRAYNVSEAVAGAAFGTALTFPGMIGALLFGWLADLLAKRGVNRAILLSVVSLAAATACVLAVTWAGDLHTATLLAMPAGLLGGGWAVGCLTGFQHLFPDRYRATATALAMTVAILLGYSSGPWLTGLLSDFHGGEDAASLRFGLTLTIPLGFVGAVLIALSARWLEAGRETLAQA